MTVDNIMVLALYFALLVTACVLYFKKGRKFKKTRAPNAESADKVMLHGHNLDQWNYLGYTRCTYVDEKGDITGEYPIFLFASKKDIKRRSYHITSEYAEKNHPYMNKHVKPWAAGEGEVYRLIGGEGNEPGDFLKQYMLDRFGVEWDSTKNHWVSSENAKYQSEQRKQQSKRKDPPNQGSGAAKDPVVIAVDFTKKEK